MLIGLEKEIHELEALYGDKGFKFIVLKGAKNSAILENFCSNKNSIYFFPCFSNNRANLSLFSKLVLSHYNDNKSSEMPFWDDAFKYIAARQKDNRLVLIIESADKLAARDSVFPKIFAKAIKEALEMSSVFLIITCIDDSFLAEAGLLQKITETLSTGTFQNERNIVVFNYEELKRTKIDQAKIFKVPADSVILNEGSVNDEIYKIISGRAVCYMNYGKPDEYVLGSLKEGRTFGEYSVLTGEPGIYTVVAFSDMLLLRINKSEFEDFITLNAANSTEIMRKMAEMLKVMRYGIKMLGVELQEHNQD